MQNMDACVTCVPGRYSTATARAVECSELCPAGKYSHTNGASCVDCAAGLHAPNEGMWECNVIAAGYYSGKETG